MKKCLPTLFFLFFLFDSIGQENTLLDSIIGHHKRLEIDSLDTRLRSLPNLKLRQLFEYEIAYQKTGKLVDVSNVELNSLNDREEIVGKYLLNTLKNRFDKKNSSIYLEQILEIYRDSEELKDTIILNEVLRRINERLLENSKNLKRYESYIELYEKYSIDSVDVFYSNLNRVFLLELQNEENPTKTNIEVVKRIDSLFSKIKNYSISPYFLGYAQSMHSVFEMFVNQNLTKALQLNRIARKNYDSVPFYFAKYGIQSVDFNTGIILFKQSNFKEAISTFRRVVKNERNAIYRMQGYDWLHRCYDSIGDYDNAYKVFKKMAQVKDSLNLLSYAKEIEVIESKYDFKEKEAELAALAKNNRLLMNKQNILIPILLGVFILASIIFVLYRKYRNKSNVLQGEQSETLKRLDEIKKIVIKNHIVLKDKRKVYVADLMYIKSDDHYLNLFLNNGNNHFVRGKLKDIKEELPPNFIQCHRSFIVNRNFVKQQLATVLLLNNERVPVSRGYKENI